jgi:hypothetical protein
MKTNSHRSSLIPATHRPISPDVKSIRPALLILLLILLPTDGWSGGATREEMRGKFETVFGNEFSIVADRMTDDRRGLNHWVAELKPEKEGLFIVRYQFQNRNWGHRFNDYELYFIVRKRGTVRGGTGRRLPDSKYELCLGDRIVVPFMCTEHSHGHSFTNASRFSVHFNLDESKWQDRHFGSRPAASHVENRAGEHVEAKGSRVFSTLQRGLSTGHDYHVDLHLKRSGRFDLELLPTGPAMSKLQGWDVKSHRISLQVIPAGESLRLFAGVLREHQSDGRGSSSGSTYYLKGHHALRVGETLPVQYARLVEPPPGEKPESEIEAPSLTIRLHPFTGRHSFLPSNVKLPAW